jgi:hypothetical protein
LSAATVGTAQATELAHGPLATGLPVVLTCDCADDHRNLPTFDH